MSDIDDDRADFTRFLAEYGFAPEFVRACSDYEGDRVPMPDWAEGRLRLQKSPIQGFGLFAAARAEAGDLLAPARIAGQRTPAGYRINHSRTPNACFGPHPNGDLHTLALRGIQAGEEVTIDYRQAASVNGMALKPDREEVAETLRLRVARLGLQLAQEEVAQLVAQALALYGYLPSFPEFPNFIAVSTTSKGGFPCHSR